MLHPSSKLENAIGNALPEIAQAVRALLAPSPALYYELNQERLRAHRGKLAALVTQLEEIRRDAFAAAVRLMSLQAIPKGEPPSYRDIPGTVHGGRAS